MTKSRRDPRYEFDGLCLRRPMIDAIANARWVETMGPGGTFLDLGANIGEIALRCSNQFDHIVCVEANPMTCEIARRRIIAAGADHVSVVNRVVAPDGAKETYWVSNPSPGAIGSTARPERRLKSRGDDYYFRVATMPLSTLLARHRPRCVKIDIEGCEFEVFDESQTAAYDRLDGVEFMIIEFHRRRDERVRTIVGRLADRGLDVANPEEFDSRTSWAAMTLMFVRQGFVLAPAATAAHRGR
jgi:FkbM family methyltransferase